MGSPMRVLQMQEAYSRRYERGLLACPGYVVETWPSQLIVGLLGKGLCGGMRWQVIPPGCLLRTKISLVRVQF